MKNFITPALICAAFFASLITLTLVSALVLKMSLYNGASPFSSKLFVFL
ncbi:hypothetical protein HY993_04220 [Candidatus Micrarchaeota archaeon]|nr:hypothetical protein [Candidatus Micrarchaeota archaeon]